MQDFKRKVQNIHTLAATDLFVKFCQLPVEEARREATKTQIWTEAGLTGEQGLRAHLRTFKAGNPSLKKENVTLMLKNTCNSNMHGMWKTEARGPRSGLWTPHAPILDHMRSDWQQFWISTFARAGSAVLHRPKAARQVSPMQLCERTINTGQTKSCMCSSSSQYCGNPSKGNNPQWVEGKRSTFINSTTKRRGKK